MKYRKIRFPKDELPHNNIIEWWYFNGHLCDKKGKSYAFMDCLFRADAKRSKIPLIEKIPLKHVYFAHSLLSDIGNKKAYKDILPLAVVSEDSFSRGLLFVNYTAPSLKGYLNYEINELEKFKYRVKSRFFDLLLEATKKPLLEGGRGFLNLDSKQTYYYSLTHLKAKGFVILGRKRIEVKGIAWMDHQWADEHYSSDIWSWFSIQLNNGVEIVCFEYDDKKKKTYLAGIVDKRGRSHHTKNVKFEHLGKYWVSKKTGAKYPMSWRISIPSYKIIIEAEAILKDQEMLFSAINYWEGPLRVNAKIKGRDVKGKGFMELVAYPMKKSLVKVYRDELRKTISEHLKTHLKETKKKILKRI
ncbi:MAG: hypothetical protein N3D84_01245 [Candidatus Woesearchaeota archaeon]|nr:hypothetical protein [Candidatus Woesearchaeota archaeon]